MPFRHAGLDEMTDQHPQSVRGWRYLLSIAALTIVLPFIILLLPVMLIWHFVPRILLRLWLPLRWGGGRCVLIAYTDSPVWTDYIEQQITARLASMAVVIQRSRVPDWKSRYRAEYWALLSWAEHASYNPVAIVFPRYKRVRVFNFYEAFREFKHGKPAELEAMTKHVLEASHKAFAR